MNTLNYIISKKIKQKRKELGVTGIEIAHSLEISQQHYSRIENGYTKITVEHLFSIAFILGVKPKELLPNYKFSNEKEMIKAKQSLSAESIMPIKKSDMYPT
ncbi:TPA: helix-turn-helix transcriptional regulator [Proteus mirabilis]|uniref:helix-turn-helix domain-containing protein n=1 Tax=Proteus mirabilis TaxID=584 RepID=UPI000665DB79|nr:helix-turn-helix transcriptional regulator [Proteus mirabilis]MBN4014386.1 helix-turn-helix transcriptional regulator [Proteus mirabilis]MBN4028111.1 helix-turn-helix transcriptional regulator [Proteus mirabilis]QSC11972.1 helix-turn-helix transcriptional regulator [Proteus mirabilis]QSC15791.1 helix-turn-helix transcriptional regulator [Proteus mirabilis]HCR4050225.1 helix-turn-helix transcriptional regulator [Proteus mirabilis]